MNINERKFMKDIGLNDLVSINLPAFVWHGFCAAYISSADFNCADANTIVEAIQRELLDPLYIKEQEAAHQASHDHAQTVFQRLISGEPPEIPPNMVDEV